MLSVKTPEEALNLIITAFPESGKCESVPLYASLGRIAFENVVSNEFVPDFDRSTVDGYAVFAESTFGCSESIPAILPLDGEVLMGDCFTGTMHKESCVAVPTGGHVPLGADAVVMLEYTENYGDGTIGILKPCAPGENMIFRGDDLIPGKTLIKKGTLITPHDIGGMASLGITEIKVAAKPRVGIISTGDELIPVSAKPEAGQIRDVNSAMLAALFAKCGAEPVLYGIVKDEKTALENAMVRASDECDVVIVSGGSSVGVKDMTAQIIEANGHVIFHGIAVKPGPPTIFGEFRSKPVFGLPGHPVAAYFITQIFVRKLIYKLTGAKVRDIKLKAKITEAISSNHGRAEVIGLRLKTTEDGVSAAPIHGKSGLITTLAMSDGYFIIPRDCEGISKNSEIEAILY